MTTDRTSIPEKMYRDVLIHAILKTTGLEASRYIFLAFEVDNIRKHYQAKKTLDVTRLWIEMSIAPGMRPAPKLRGLHVTSGVFS